MAVLPWGYQCVLSPDMHSLELEPVGDPVRHGRWMPERSIKSIPDIVRCSCCGMGFGKIVAENEYRYCPHCGALMDKGA